MKHTINPVFRGLNRRLLLLGVERKSFFCIISFSLAFFELSDALAPALILFVTLLASARLAGRADPELLRIVLNTRRFATRYDPAKWSPREEKGVASRGPAQKAV